MKELVNQIHALKLKLKPPGPHDPVLESQKAFILFSTYLLNFYCRLGTLLTEGIK